MKKIAKLVVNIFLFLVGAALIVLAATKQIENLWLGFGGGFAGIAIGRILQVLHEMKDPDYAKQVETAQKDERTKFISSKAKSWAFYLTVLLLAIVGVVLLILKQTPAGFICLGIVCGMVLIYTLVYLILARKY